MVFLLFLTPNYLSEIMNDKIPDEIINKIVLSFKPIVAKKPSKAQIPHRIKVNGQYVTLRSGKSLWKSIGNAKAALNNHLSDLEYHRIPYSEVKILQSIGGKLNRRYMAGIIEILVKEGIVEFVPHTDDSDLSKLYD